MFGEVSPVVQQLFPSLGFFGCNSTSCWEILCGVKCSGIRLQLNDSNKGFLNLRKVKIFLAGGELFSMSPDTTCLAISSRGGADPKRLIEGGGFHSGYELNPWWQIEFGKELPVEKVEIYNRGDKWGRRSRKLRADFLQGDELVLSEKAQFSECEAAVNYFLALTGLNLGFIDSVLMNFDFDKFRSEILVPKVIDEIRNNNITNKEYRWSYFVSHVWSDTPADDCDIDLVAELLAWKMQYHGVSMDDFKACSSILFSKRKFLEFEGKFKDICLSRTGKNVMLTKHGVSPAGKLTNNCSSAITSLTKFFKLVENHSTSCILGYGTLLGAVRDGSFIEHDDDIDVIVDLNCTSLSDARQKMADLSKCMEEYGYRVGAVNEHLNRHFIDPESKVVIDCFPFWREGGKAFLHMENMKFRGIDQDIFSSLTYVDLCGEKYPAPIKHEEFLEERYSVSWKTPDRFHEWPWSMEEDV